MQPKDVHIAIKRDDGLTYLMKRFSLNESEIEREIKKLLPNGANKLIKQLNRNRKKCEKAEMPKETEKTEKLEKVESNTTVSENRQVISNSTVVDERESYDTLKEKETKLQNIITKLGRELTCVAEETVKARKLLEQARCDYEIEIAKIRELEAHISLIYTDCLEKQTCEERIVLSLRRKREELDEIQNKLRSCRAINILMFQNGTLELEGATLEGECDIKREAEEFFNQLLEREEFYELSINSMKALAKALAVEKQFTKKAYFNIEVVFEDVGAQKAWEQLHNK